MMKKFFIYILLALVPLAFVGCGGGEPEKKPQVKKAGPAAKKKAAKPTSIVPKKKAPAVVDVPLIAPKRNPFKSFIVEVGPEDDGRIRGPLECCELALFRLTAVVSGIGESRGLVLSPEGKRYIVKVGDLMGTRGGRVTSVEKGRIVVLEQIKNPKGVVISEEYVEITLPSEEERAAQKKNR